MPMKLRFALFISILFCYGFYPSASIANDKPALLEPVDEYSFCTPYYGDTGFYSLGVVGKDWALTFEVPQESFSGNFQTKKAYFYRGPHMPLYIGRPAGPARPSVPTTKEYIKIELAGITVEIQRIKVYDKVMGPIEVVVDDFTVSNQQFHIPGKVNISCVGPLP